MNIYKKLKEHNPSNPIYTDDMKYRETVARLPVEYLTLSLF